MPTYKDIFKTNKKTIRETRASIIKAGTNIIHILTPTDAFSCVLRPAYKRIREANFCAIPPKIGIILKMLELNATVIISLALASKSSSRPKNHRIL